MDLNIIKENIDFIIENRKDNRPVEMSVVIVTYNREMFLITLLKSLEKQDFNDFEIIVVDNNSADNTQKIVQNSNLLYIRLNKNYGLSFARNIGIKYAKGNIVCFLDDDADVDNTFTQAHYTAHTHHEILCLRGKALPQKSSIYNCIPELYDLGNQIIPSPITLEGNSSFKKYVLETVGGFKEDLIIHRHEGLEITYRIMKKYQCEPSKIIYYPDAVIYHDYAKSYFNLVTKMYLNQMENLSIRKKSSEMTTYLNKFPEISVEKIHKSRTCFFVYNLYKLHKRIIRKYIKIRFYFKQ